MMDYDAYREMRARRGAVLGESRADAVPVPPAEALLRAEAERRTAVAVEEAHRIEAVREAKRNRPPAEITDEIVATVGHGPAEIAEVVDGIEGTVVRLRLPGPLLVIVPEDRPDALGRTGLMVLPGTGEPGALPVYEYAVGAPVPEGDPFPVGDPDDVSAMLGLYFGDGDPEERAASGRWLEAHGIERRS